MIVLLLIFCSFVSQCMDVEHIESTSVEDVSKPSQEQYSIKLSDGYFVAAKQPLLMFPYFKSLMSVKKERRDKDVIDLFEMPYTKDSFTLVIKLVEIIYQEYQSSQFPEQISFYVKSEIVNFLKNVSLKNILLCIKAFHYFGASKNIINFLCVEFINRIQQFIKQHLNEELDLGEVDFDRYELLYFDFLKDRIINILAAANFMVTFKRPFLKVISDPSLGNVILDEAFVSQGNLYAFMHRTNSGNVVSLVDLLTQEIKESSAKHDITGENKYNPVTALYPAVYKNVVASVMQQDDRVLFHSFDKTYSPLKLNTPEFTSLVRYALSADGLFFLALYKTIHEQYLHIFNVEKSAEKPQKIEIATTIKNPSGCVFNPLDSNSFVFWGYNSCNVVYKKRISDGYKFIQKELLSKDNEEIIGAQFSSDGTCIYVLTTYNEAEEKN